MAILNSQMVGDLCVISTRSPLVYTLNDSHVTLPYPFFIIDLSLTNCSFNRGAFREPTKSKNGKGNSTGFTPNWLTRTRKPFFRLKRSTDASRYVLDSDAPGAFSKLPRKSPTCGMGNHSNFRYP